MQIAPVSEYGACCVQITIDGLLSPSSMSCRHNVERSVYLKRKWRRKAMANVRLDGEDTNSRILIEIVHERTDRKKQHFRKLYVLDKYA
jgi:hypothetical protein